MASSVPACFTHRAACVTDILGVQQPSSSRIAFRAPGSDRRTPPRGRTLQAFQEGVTVKATGRNMAISVGCVASSVIDLCVIRLPLLSSILLYSRGNALATKNCERLKSQELKCLIDNRGNYNCHPEVVNYSFTQTEIF